MKYTILAPTEGASEAKRVNALATLTTEGEGNFTVDVSNEALEVLTFDVSDDALEIAGTMSGMINFTWGSAPSSWRAARPDYRREQGAILLRRAANAERLCTTRAA
jgi:hypothetical protein